VVTAGGLLMARLLAGSNRLHRWQGTALLAAIAVPMTVHALFVLDVLPVGLDPTGVSYVAAGLVLSVAILRRELFDLTPVMREIGREAALSEIDDRVFILDDEGRIVDANPAAAALFGLALERLPGQHLDDHLPALAAALPESPRHARIDLPLERDGVVRHYDVRVTPLYRAYGVVSGLLVSLRDVTERRQREQRLDVLNRLLRHNLRNDLNLVRGSAELLESSVPEKERYRIDQMTETIDALVASSNKIGQIADALEDDRTRTFDVAEELDRIVADARRRYPDASISVDCPEGTVVEAGLSMAAPLEELIDNAVQHTAGRASIRIRVTEADHQQIAISVSDDGPGIDQQEREAVTTGEETPLRHGSGVGLWLVKWIVRKYGGTLSFGDDEGTTVTITLPRGDAHSDGERPLPET